MYFISSTTDLTQELNPNAQKIVEQVGFFSLHTVSYLAPLLFLSGPFVLIVTIFHFRQTMGTWVGCICGLFAVTFIQLMNIFPLHNKTQNVFSTSNLTWILVIYAVSTVSSGAYYLRALYRKRVEIKAENLHPLLAIGAVVFNVCFLYPIIASNDRWLWGLCFVAVNLFMGLIILLGRSSTLNSNGNDSKTPLIFISYAKDDRAFANRLYNKLKDVGFKPWLDIEDILPGEEWDFKIKQTLRQSDFLLICLSEKSITKRGYIQKEIRMAVDIAKEMPEGTIFLIPVRLEECKMPTSIDRYHCVDMFKSDGFNRLVKAIQTEWKKRH
jgi:hypothetical protein